MEEEVEMSMPLWRMLVEMDRDLLKSIDPRSGERIERKLLKDQLVQSGPALIAMKGLPRTNKSYCASSIASSLRCGHLDIDDIQTCTRQMLQQQQLLLPADPEESALASVYSDLEDLSYRALLRLASDQLLLGHDVVIDSPLSRPSGIVELRELADSNGVPLIIVECTVLNKSEWRKNLMAKHLKGENSSPFYSKHDITRLLDSHQLNFDHGDDNVTKLVIDTAQDRFSAGDDDLIEVILQFILLYKQNIEVNCRATATSGNESGAEEGKLKRHFSHFHPLVFVPKQDRDDMITTTAAASDCRICLQSIMESSYRCPDCDFIAHESCINLPQYTRSTLHHHPLGLYVLSYFDNKMYGEDIECIVCNGANSGPIYRCWQCYGVFVHDRCAQLSHELNHPCHDHPLKLKTYDLFCSRNQFTCRACGHEGGNISYGCSACKIKLHLTCALDIPHAVEYTCAQRHSLVLASPPKDNKYDDYYCDICEEARHHDYWIYYCASCPFHAHLNCVIPEIPAYEFIKAEADNSRNATSENEYEHRSADDDEDDAEDDNDEEEEEEDDDDDDDDGDDDDIDANNDHHGE